jgi:hypothetical protein
MRSHKKHDSSDLQKAIDANASEPMSSSDVAKYYSVTERTIHNHKRRSPAAIGSRCPDLLRIDEENYIAQLLLDLQQTGYRLTKRIVMEISIDSESQFK